MALTPMYLQIAQQLAGDIATGIYPVGSRLPTEAALCSSHSISRSTAREALRCLVDRGMIRRMVRVGSEVIAAAPINEYQPVAANAEDLVSFASGTRVEGGVGSQVVADSHLAARIGCREGARLYRYAGARRARDKDSPPLCWSEQYLPADFPASARQAMVEGSFSAEAAGQVRVEQTVSADLLNEEIARHLQAEPGSAALVITRRHHFPDGRFYAAGIHRHPADRYQLQLPVQTTTSAAAEA